MIALLALVLQSGHVFEPVDPSWRLIEDTLEPRSGAFVFVQPRHLKRRDTWSQKRYSVDGRDRKLLRYDPQGRLRIESDFRDGEQFTRTLRADGSLACYQHYRSPRLVEAFSVSRDGRTVHHVQDGIGELVLEGEAGTWTHLRLLREITIAEDYREDRRARLSL